MKKEIKEEQKYIDYFSENNMFSVKSIDNVNHKPHPFLIGAKHVHHASEHHSGMLGTATIEAVGCAFKDCTLSYAEHTSDKVLFLQLLRDLTQKKAQKELKGITDMMKKDKIDGLCFVETESKFRIK
jgi:hypothetical protein